MVECHARRFLEPETTCLVVHEVSTNTGGIKHDRDIVTRKLRSRTDAGKHQNLRRVYGAPAKGVRFSFTITYQSDSHARDDDLLGRPCAELGSQFAHARFAGKLNTNCTWDTTGGVKKNLGDTGVGDDLQIWASKDLISEVCRLGRHTSALAINVCHYGSIFNTC
jgi:hypothetical protein